MFGALPVLLLGTFSGAPRFEPGTETLPVCYVVPLDSKLFIENPIQGFEEPLIVQH